jgi:hypothetical protein
MYIVTGASDNHFRSLLQFLRSIPSELLSSTFVWNLGLSDANVLKLEEDFPTTHKRRFPFEEYPKYFDIHVAAGEYAWKPVAIAKIVQEVQEIQHENTILLWCDAGNRAMSADVFQRIEAVVRQQGVYTPTSWGTVRRWTHPSCLQYFSLDSGHPMLELWPRNGAIVGFDVSNASAKAFLHNWAHLAQIKECIAPEGSDRENHRQDQAVLTILYYLFTNNQYLENSDLNMATHQDCD